MMTRCLFAIQQNRHSLAVVDLLLLLLTLLLPFKARAGEIVLSGVGNGQWQVSATGLANVHALDLYLGYDSQRLSDLTATVGAGLTGVMTAINDKTPGSIRLGVASMNPLAPSCILLNLHSSESGAEMVVSQFIVESVDAKGKIVPTTIRQQLNSLPQIPSGPPDETAATSTVSAQPLIVTPRHGDARSGNENFPADSSAKVSTVEEEEVQTPPVPPPPVTDPNEADESSTINSAAVIPDSSGTEKRFHSQEEIVTAIDRLPQPWTVAAIKALFLKPAITNLTKQQPPVVLADGKSKVSLYLLKSLSQNTPTVAVQGCTLGSIWDAKEQGWEVEFVTQKGVWPAKALLLGDGDLVQFPIVIVPVLAISPPQSDNDAIPSIDLDGDMSITALDAYLYVGNLLAQYGP
jgi:hypothetical protein